MFSAKLADLQAYECSEPGCPKKPYDHWRLLCVAHYTWQRRRGLLKPDNPAERRRAHRLVRFLALVQKTETCWLWQGGTQNGYGKFSGSGAHRASYQLFKGPIEDGLTVNHLCFVPLCVNPDHLRLLTLSENASNNSWGRATTCRQGHEWSTENTYMATRDGRSVRECRACRRERWAIRRAAGGKH